MPDTNRLGHAQRVDLSQFPETGDFCRKFVKGLPGIDFYEVAADTIVYDGGLIDASAGDWLKLPGCKNPPGAGTDVVADIDPDRRIFVGQAHLRPASETQRIVDTVAPLPRSLSAPPACVQSDNASRAACIAFATCPGAVPPT